MKDSVLNVIFEGHGCHAEAPHLMRQLKLKFNEQANIILEPEAVLDKTRHESFLQQIAHPMLRKQTFNIILIHWKSPQCAYNGNT